MRYMVGDYYEIFIFGATCMTRQYKHLISNIHIDDIRLQLQKRSWHCKHSISHVHHDIYILSKGIVYSKKTGENNPIITFYQKQGNLYKIMWSYQCHQASEKDILLSFLAVLGYVHRQTCESYSEERELNGESICIEKRPSIALFLSVTPHEKSNIIESVMGNTNKHYTNITIHTLYELESGIPYSIIQNIPRITFADPPGRHTH